MTSVKKNGPPSAAGANVVILLVDALRADRFSPGAMPLMFEYAAKRGVRFDTALAQAPWTAPSVASIFTGLYTHAHGVKTPRVQGVDVSLAMLGEDFDTLAESFRNSGYSTAAFVPNDWLTPDLGFSQGFDVFDNLRFKERAAVMNEKALAWAASLGAGKPFFLYMHYMDVHGPYDPPMGYRDKFTGRYKSRKLTRDEFSKQGYLALGPWDNPFARDLKYYLASYDGGAAYADEQLRDFLLKLEKISPPEKTIVVLTADHGEAFFEHGYPDHGHTLFDEEIRVPLVFFPPAGGGLSFSEQVELVDIFPTLADLAGVPKPGYAIPGVSLAAAIAGGEPPAGRAAWSSCYIRGPRRAAVRTPDLKIISNLQRPPDLRVYDLRSDPRETKDLTAGDPNLARKAIKIFNTKAKANFSTGPRNAEPAEKKLDPETVKRLKSLNYLE